MDTTTRPAGSPARRAATRTTGFWLAVAAGLYQLVNAVRAVADPAGFSGAYGVPVDGSAGRAAGGGAGEEWVLVYASRTAVIGLVVLVLAARRDVRALAWFAAVAVLLPVADAVLTASSGAPAATVGRHAAIAVALAVVAVLLGRAARSPRPGPAVTARS